MGQRRYGMILYGPFVPAAALSAVGICLPSERLRVHGQRRGAQEAALMLPIPSQKDLRRIVLHDIR